MIPTWVAVVSGISLAILALSAIVIALSSVAAALGVREFLRVLRELAGPALGDVRQLIGAIRVEADGLVGTSREMRGRIVAAADAAQARLADLDGYRTWMRRTGLFRRSGQTSGGPVGLGTAYFDATRMGTFRGEVTDYEPPARIGFRETLRWFGSDLMEARPVYILEADRDKTIVVHIAEGELFGMMRLMKPVAALLARSERARTVESLRRSLESE